MNRSALCIDTSYYVFHRFFATYRWYQYQTKDMSEDVATKDEQFMNAFYKHVHNDFRNFQVKYPQHDIWMMMDCPRSNIWRTELFTGYKATRTHASHFDGGIFPCAYKFFEDIKSVYDLRFVKAATLEADDLCYICQKEWIATGKYDRIVILANDNDYLQLISDSVDVVNKEGKRIAERGSGDPNKDVLIKILAGDKSDNIPPVYKGVGVKTADKLATMTEEDRRAWLATKGDTALQQYEINTKLIQFTHIPEELVAEVVQNLKEI